MIALLSHVNVSASLRFVSRSKIRRDNNDIQFDSIYPYMGVEEVLTYTAIPAFFHDY